jgi:hypothetical protein
MPTVFDCRGHGFRRILPSMGATAISSGNPPRIGRHKNAGRSRITNGSALLLGVDGRSAWIRRCKDVIAAHVSDLGGEDNTSAAERSIIRRASVMTVELERLETKFARAGAAKADDLDLYQRTAGNLRRLLEAVGIQRRPRDVTPTLNEYLRAREVVE